MQYSQQNYIKHGMRDIDLAFGVPSSQGFYQDFQHVDQFHVNGISSSNQIFGVQNQTLDSFDNFTYGCSSAAGFDVYECKPFVENNGGGHAHVMDNFQYGGYGLSLPQRNQFDMMVSNQSYLPFNVAQETKPMNFVVPDEVSCISPINYYKSVGVNKNNRAYTTSRRFRKKSNIVKGQWTEAEDRYQIEKKNPLDLLLLFLWLFNLIKLYLQFGIFILKRKTCLCLHKQLVDSTGGRTWIEEMV